MLDNLYLTELLIVHKILEPCHAARLLWKWVEGVEVEGAGSLLTPPADNGIITASASYAARRSHCPVHVDLVVLKQYGVPYQHVSATCTEP